MKKRRKNFILYFILCLFILPVFFQVDSYFFCCSLQAASLRCSICRKKISGRYLKDNKGKVFCSQKCLNKALPKCSVCGKPSKFSNGEEYFCSNKCLKSTWPLCTFCNKKAKGGVLRGYKKKFLCHKCAKLPKCFSCYQPADSAKFNDGRFICKKCHRTAISDPDKIKKIANEVRTLMKDKLGLGTDHKIEYQVVSSDELSKKTEHQHQGLELGLYRFEQVIEKTTTTRSFMGKTEKTSREVIKSETHTVYFLYGIPENKLREVAAHELAHDWMQEFYPEITDLKTKEGWAEFVASKVNIIYGRGEMNKRMEMNPDSIYGAGYRMLKKVSLQNDPESVYKFLESKTK